MKRLNLKVNSVIFDLDGVITDTMPFHYRAWRSVLAQAGIMAKRNDVYLREGQRGITSVWEIFNEHKKPCTRKIAEHLLRRKELIFKRTVRPRFIPGSRSFLKNLHAAHINLAIVTGTSRREVYKILPEYLIKLFKIIVTGSDVTQGKPHPQPYYQAIRGLKVKPSQTVVIENAPLGIKSAKAAGLTCLALETSLRKEHLFLADAIYPSISILNQRVRFIPDNGEPLRAL